MPRLGYYIELLRCTLISLILWAQQIRAGTKKRLFGGHDQKAEKQEKAVANPNRLLARFPPFPTFSPFGIVPVWQPSDLSKNLGIRYISV